MNGRRIAAGLLVAGLLGAGPSAAVGAELPVAGGSVVLEGSASGWTRLHIPEDTAVDIRFERRDDGLDHFAAMHAEGEGRLVGFHLVREGRRFGDAAVSALRLPVPNAGIGSFGLAAKSAEFRDNPDQGLCTRGTEPLCPLAAGDYVLYLVADDAPARVEIRFEGLAGQTVIPEDALTPVAIDRQVTTEATTGAGSAAAEYWGGAVTGTLEARGDVISLLWFDGGDPPLGVGQYGRCSYSDTPPGGEVVPGCPGGSHFALGPAVSTGGIDLTNIARTRNASAGTTTRGGYTLHGGTDIKQAGAAAVWIPFVTP